MKNVILAATRGLSGEDLGPFLRSFARWTSTDTHLVLCGPGADFPSVEEFNRISTHTVGKEWAILDRMLHIHATRFWWYRDALEFFPTHPNVMLADARDTVFQGDPFQELQGQKLVVSADDRLVQVRDVFEMKDFFQSYLGENTAREFDFEPVHYPTTVMAPFRTMIRYVHELIIQMTALRLTPGYGSDVVAHYLTLRSKELPYEILFPDVSRFGTVGYYGADGVAFDEKGRWTNQLGLPYLVVHMYDRNMKGSKRSYLEKVG